MMMETEEENRSLSDMQVEDQTPRRMVQWGEEAPDQLRLLYPMVNEAETPFPTEWSTQHRHESIRVDPKKLQVYYKAANRTIRGAASVRANHPIPPNCGLYYYEVLIKDVAEQDSNIAVGVYGLERFDTDVYPGMKQKSWGYHGSDAHVHCNLKKKKDDLAGSAFRPGDVIGCCVNFVDNTLFFVRNGRTLMNTHGDLTRRLYPAVGLSASGDVVDTNFGQYKFLYDVHEVMEGFRRNTAASIMRYPTLGNGTMCDMVLKYLIHHGYTETASALAKTCGNLLNDAELDFIQNRKKVLTMVSEGKIREAIIFLSIMYPGLLENRKSLAFDLHCREFVEMIAQIDCPNNGRTNHHNGIVISTNFFSDSEEVGSTEKGPNHVRKKRKSESPSDEPEHEVKVPVNNVSSWKNPEFVMRLVDLGQQLSKKYWELDRLVEEKFLLKLEKARQAGRTSAMPELTRAKCVDEKRDRYHTRMNQVLSLIAYESPRSAPTSWLLDPGSWEYLYHRVNRAVLKHGDNTLNLPEDPVLDTIMAHASELLKLMACLHMGNSVFVDRRLIAIVKPKTT